MNRWQETVNSGQWTVDCWLFTAHYLLHTDPPGFLDPKSHCDEGDEADYGAGNKEEVVVQAGQDGANQGGKAAGDAGGGAG